MKYKTKEEEQHIGEKKTTSNEETTESIWNYICKNK